MNMKICPMPELNSNSANSGFAHRQRWMAVLAKAPPQLLEEAVTAITALPAYTILRAPEAGLVMVQGRAGGAGQRFNLGEMTVTRCSVRLDNGVDGHAYVAGRNGRHAELAAMCDAMLQTPEWHDRLQSQIVHPLATARREKREAALKKANATKVNFFTMTRGEDKA